MNINRIRLIATTGIMICFLSAPVLQADSSKTQLELDCERQAKGEGITDKYEVDEYIALCKRKAQKAQKGSTPGSR